MTWKSGVVAGLRTPPLAPNLSLTGPTLDLGGERTQEVRESPWGWGVKSHFKYEGPNRVGLGHPWKGYVRVAAGKSGSSPGDLRWRYGGGSETNGDTHPLRTVSRPSTLRHGRDTGREGREESGESHDLDSFRPCTGGPDGNVRDQPLTGTPTVSPALSRVPSRVFGVWVLPHPVHPEPCLSPQDVNPSTLRGRGLL